MIRARRKGLFSSIKATGRPKSPGGQFVESRDQLAEAPDILNRGERFCPIGEARDPLMSISRT